MRARLVTVRKRVDVALFVFVAAYLLRCGHVESNPCPTDSANDLTRKQASIVSEARKEGKVAYFKRGKLVMKPRQPDPTYRHKWQLAAASNFTDASARPSVTGTDTTSEQPTSNCSGQREGCGHSEGDSNRLKSSLAWRSPMGPRFQSVLSKERYIMVLAAVEEEADNDDDDDDDDETRSAGTEGSGQALTPFFLSFTFPINLTCAADPVLDMEHTSALEYPFLWGCWLPLWMTSSGLSHRHLSWPAG
ncbi:hypothetical protein ACOMHN_000282 [Nucella lapillus]